jgi:hypothetical protein
MEQHNFESILAMPGKLSQQAFADPEAFECAHCIRTLQSYKRAEIRAAREAGTADLS